MNRRHFMLGMGGGGLAIATFQPTRAFANVFDDLGEGLVKFTGLRGVIQGLAGGAGAGLREQMNQFVDQKVNPLIDRINQIISQQIANAVEGAKQAMDHAEAAMRRLIDYAQTRVSEMTEEFFKQLNETLDNAFKQLDDLIDRALCRVMPDGSFEVRVPPFARGDQIKVKRPANTECYRIFPEAQGNPPTATFERWEYYRGELCEYELKLNRIDPADPESISKSIAAYDKLTEVADAARCTAKTPTAKAEMSQKVYLFQSRAAFFRQLKGVSRP